jgi:hypothetical protein
VALLAENPSNIASTDVKSLATHLEIVRLTLPARLRLESTASVACALSTPFANPSLTASLLNAIQNAGRRIERSSWHLPSEAGVRDSQAIR